VRLFAPKSACAKIRHRAIGPDPTGSQEDRSCTRDEAADDDPDVAWRVDALCARLVADPRTTDLVVQNLPATPGACRSCGDPMPYGQVGKRTLCCLASAAILKERAWRDVNR
jgi:hypothetical protein